MNCGVEMLNAFETNNFWQLVSWYLGNRLGSEFDPVLPWNFDLDIFRDQNHCSFLYKGSNYVPRQVSPSVMLQEYAFFKERDNRVREKIEGGVAILRLLMDS